ncbi:MAG: hypothetical protein ACI8RD_014278, partial [Bacillariaceae sp.]
FCGHGLFSCVSAELNSFLSYMLFSSNLGRVNCVCSVEDKGNVGVTYIIHFAGPLSTTLMLFVDCLDFLSPFELLFLENIASLHGWILTTYTDELRDG